jgi:hypothetical protein
VPLAAAVIDLALASDFIGGQPVPNDANRHFAD